MPKNAIFDQKNELKMIKKLRKRAENVKMGQKEVDKRSK